MLLSRSSLTPTPSATQPGRPPALTSDHIEPSAMSLSSADSPKALTTGVCLQRHQPPPLETLQITARTFHRHLSHTCKRNPDAVPDRSSEKGRKSNLEHMDCRPLRRPDQSMDPCRRPAREQRGIRGLGTARVRTTWRTRKSFRAPGMQMAQGWEEKGELPQDPGCVRAAR